jgi:FkbM family methyltransferase
VRSRARKRLAAVAKASVGAMGFQLSRVPDPDSVLATMNQRRLKLLRDDKVSLVLDVGANVGQFGTRVRQLGYDGRMVSFEPLAAPYADLERRTEDDDLWTARRLALGENDYDSTINVSANTWSSSLLPVSRRHVDAAPDSVYVAQEAVEVSCLDSIAADILSPTDVIYMKLDVQGYEIEVLRGARKTLSQVVLVEVELSLCTLYEGQAPCFEVMQVLDGYGYDPVAFDNEFVEPRTGRVLQINAMFERRRS